MDWAAIGAVGEILGALAVVLTLLYLARQVRQTSAQLHSSTSWSITQALTGINSRLSSDQEFTELWLRGLRDPRSLDDVEAERFRVYAMDLLNLAVYVHAHPTPEHRFLVPYLASVAQRSPGFREMIESAQWSLPADLGDELLRDASSDISSE